MRALALAALLSWFAAPAGAAGASSARTAPRQQPATGVAPVVLPPLAPQMQTGGLAGSLDMGGVLRAPGASPLATPFLDPRALPGVGFRPEIPVAPLPESAVAPRAEAAAFLETFAPRLALPLTAPPPSAAMVTPASPLAQQSALMATRQTAVAEATSAMAREAAPAAETSQAFGDRVWTLLMGQKSSDAGDSSAAPDEKGFSDLGAARSGRSEARASRAGSLSPALPRSASERSDPAAARTAVPSVAAQVEQVLSWPARFDLGGLFGPAQPAAAASGRALSLPIRRLVLKVYSMSLGVAYAQLPGVGSVLQASTSLAAPRAGQSKAAAPETVFEAPTVAMRDAVSSTGFESRTFGARAAPERAAPGAEAERFAFLQGSGERLPLDGPSFEPPSSRSSSSPFSRKGSGPAPAAFLVVTLLPVLGAALMLAAGRE